MTPAPSAPAELMRARWRVAGTGGRDLADPELVRRHLDPLLLEQARAHPGMLVISGIAEGFDELLARRAVALNISFWAAVPNAGYGRYYWGQHSISNGDRLDEFEALLARAAGVTYVCEGIHEDGVHANFVRNQWMVERADVVLVGPGDRGTADCARRARKAGVATVSVMEPQMTLGV